VLVVLRMCVCPADTCVMRVRTPHLHNYCTCHQFITMHHIRTPTGRHCCSFLHHPLAQLNANGKAKARTHPVCTSPRPASPGSGARAQLNRGFSVSSASGRSAYSTVTAHPDCDAPMLTSPRSYRHVPSARHTVVMSRCARLCQVRDIRL
jgi:hypothetical protein